MKITNIRKAGKKLTFDEQCDLKRDLQLTINQAGFIADVMSINSTRIDIGLHSKSFSVDTNVHGYNTRHNPFKSPCRTNTPSWDQRVTYNNLINDVLNRLEISATVKSGPFTIRKGTLSYNENDWHQQKPEYLHHNESRGYYIEEGFDEENFKERRREKARQARLARKMQQNIGLRLVGKQ